MLVGRVKGDLYGAHYKDDGITHFGQVESIQTIQSQILSRFGLKLDKPLLMTESTAKLGTHLDYYVDAAYRNGWAGILIWTYYQLIGYHEFNHHKEIVTSKDNKGAENVQFFQNWQKQHYEETEIVR
jgi:thiaminase